MRSARRGKSFEHALEVPRARPRLRHLQVFQHRQAAENLAALRHVADAEPGDAVRRPARGVLAEDLDRALPRRRQADQAAHGRGLAGAVAAEHGDDLAFVHLERDAMQDVALAVERMDVVGAQDGGHSIDPQIGGAHFRIGGDRVRRAFGQHAALVEHGDALRDAEHDIHVVLDEQDAHALLAGAAGGSDRPCDRFRCRPCRRSARRAAAGAA